MKNNKKYLIVVIIGIVLGIAAIGVGCYFAFITDNNKKNNNEFNWHNSEGNAKELMISTDEKNVSYNCNSVECQTIEIGKNFALIKDNGYYIYDINKKLSLKLDVDIGDKNNSIISIIEKKDDILGIFYSNENDYYYSIEESKNYSLNYALSNDMVYEIVKDGYYQARDDESNEMIINYRTNKTMLTLQGGCSGINNYYGNLDKNSYYYVYNTECGEGRYRQYIYTKDFKEVGNNSIGYYFYDFGLDENGNYIVSTDMKNIMIIDEKGTILDNRQYVNIIDGKFGYYIVNNNSKIQLLKYDGSLIEDFTETFKGKKLDNLIGGDSPFSTVATMHYNENNERIVQYSLAYSDFSKENDWYLEDAKIINYTIIYNVDTNLASIIENSN